MGFKLMNGTTGVTTPASTLLVRSNEQRSVERRKKKSDAQCLQSSLAEHQVSSNPGLDSLASAQSTLISAAICARWPLMYTATLYIS